MAVRSEPEYHSNSFTPLLGTNLFAGHAAVAPFFFLRRPFFIVRTKGFNPARGSVAFSDWPGLLDW